MEHYESFVPGIEDRIKAFENSLAGTAAVAFKAAYIGFERRYDRPLVTTATGRS
jgi:hypothetical protein